MAPVEGDVRGVVHNPIDVDSLPVGYEKEEWLLWLGRITPVKGPHRAIRVFSPDRVAAGYEAIYHDALVGGVEAARAAPDAWQPAA